MSITRDDAAFHDAGKDLLKGYEELGKAELRLRKDFERETGNQGGSAEKAFDHMAQNGTLFVDSAKVAEAQHKILEAKKKAYDKLTPEQQEQMYNSGLAAMEKSGLVPSLDKQIESAQKLMADHDKAFEKYTGPADGPGAKAYHKEHELLEKNIALLQERKQHLDAYKSAHPDKAAAPESPSKGGSPAPKANEDSKGEGDEAKGSSEEDPRKKKLGQINNLLEGPLDEKKVAQIIQLILELMGAKSAEANAQSQDKGQDQGQNQGQGKGDGLVDHEDYKNAVGAVKMKLADGEFTQAELDNLKKNGGALDVIIKHQQQLQKLQGQLTPDDQAVLDAALAAKNAQGLTEAKTHLDTLVQHIADKDMGGQGQGTGQSASATQKDNLDLTDYVKTINAKQQALTGDKKYEDIELTGDNEKDRAALNKRHDEIIKKLKDHEPPITTQADLDKFVAEEKKQVELVQRLRAAEEGALDASDPNKKEKVNARVNEVMQGNVDAEKPIKGSPTDMMKLGADLGRETEGMELLSERRKIYEAAKTAELQLTKPQLFEELEKAKATNDEKAQQAAQAKIDAEINKGLVEASGGKLSVDKDGHLNLPPRDQAGHIATDIAERTGMDKIQTHALEKLRAEAIKTAMAEETSISKDDIAKIANEKDPKKVQAALDEIAKDNPDLKKRVLENADREMQAGLKDAFERAPGKTAEEKISNSVEAMDHANKDLAEKREAVLKYREEAMKNLGAQKGIDVKDPDLESKLEQAYGGKDKLNERLQKEVDEVRKMNTKQIEGRDLGEPNSAIGRMIDNTKERVRDTREIEKSIEARGVEDKEKARADILAERERQGTLEKDKGDTQKTRDHADALDKNTQAIGEMQKKLESAGLSAEAAERITKKHVQKSEDLQLDSKKLADTKEVTDNTARVNDRAKAVEANLKALDKNLEERGTNELDRKAELERQANALASKKTSEIKDLTKAIDTDTKAVKEDMTAQKNFTAAEFGSENKKLAEERVTAVSGPPDFSDQKSVEASTTSLKNSKDDLQQKQDTLAAYKEQLHTYLDAKERAGEFKGREHGRAQMEAYLVSRAGEELYQGDKETIKRYDTATKEMEQKLNEKNKEAHLLEGDKKDKSGRERKDATSVNEALEADNKDKADKRRADDTIKDAAGTGKRNEAAEKQKQEAESDIKDNKKQFETLIKGMKVASVVQRIEDLGDKMPAAFNPGAAASGAAKEQGGIGAKK